MTFPWEFQTDPKWAAELRMAANAQQASAAAIMSWASIQNAYKPDPTPPRPKSIDPKQPMTDAMFRALVRHIRAATP